MPTALRSAQLSDTFEKAITTENKERRTDILIVSGLASKIAVILEVYPLAHISKCRRIGKPLRALLTSDAERQGVDKMSSAQRWNEVYSAKPADKVGWYTPHLNTSLGWIHELSLKPNEAIIDVGGGASTLVDDLLDVGHNNITVLDLSKRAIQLTQERLGARFSSVTWMEGNVTEAKLPIQHYRLWHDRAVFHFLVQPKERQRYKVALLKALRIDGFVIIGTFSPDAPPQCSGLPVQRYTADTLSEYFGDKFELRRHQYESHTTPSGVKQSYVYCLYQRTA